MYFFNKLKLAKFSLILLSIFLISHLVLVTHAVEKPSRVINVVYDDSNSMLNDGKQTWSYARYAIQVFAALLEEKDVLNIYFMSDHTKVKQNAPTYTILGSEDAITRVKKVYEMAPSNTGGTPYQPVVNAFNDLPNELDQTQDTWLVILTDGAFENKKSSDIDDDYAKFVTEKPKLKIANLIIGDIGSSLPKQTNSVFVYQAAQQEDITSKIAELGQRIFNRNKLDVNLKNGKYSIDLDGVPMEEIIVFVQGNNVDVKGIGNLTLSKSSVSVQMKPTDVDKATTNLSKQIVSANLNGVVVSFKPNSNQVYIEPGQYDLNISGVVSGPIQVFYKPKVDVLVELLNENNEVVDEGKIVSGDYILSYKLVDPKDPSKIINSESILGLPEFSPIISNNGNSIDIVNNKISVVSGDLKIKVIARYLEYNTLIDEKIFKVQEKGSTISLDLTNTNHTVTNLTLDPPIIIALRQNGELLSQEKWNSINPNDIQILVNEDKEWEWLVERGDSISTFNLYPQLLNNDKYLTPTGEIPIKIDVKMLYEEQTSLGNYMGFITISDDISQMSRVINWFEKNGIKALISLIFLITLFGYIPGVKKYLPSRWRKRGHNYKIYGSAKRRGEEIVQKAKVRIDLASTLTPYKSERGQIQILAPQDSPKGIPTRLNVRAGEKGSVYITNIKNINNSSFKIDDNAIDVNKFKKNGYKVRRNFAIRYETETHYYDVNPYMKAQ